MVMRPAVFRATVLPSLDKGLLRWLFARALGNGFRANAVCECSLTAQQISVPAWYRLELENPRNPTVVLIPKIPRVLTVTPCLEDPVLFFPPSLAALNLMQAAPGA